MSTSSVVEELPTGARKVTIIGTILFGGFVFSLNARGTVLQSPVIVQAFALDRYKVQWITGAESMAGLTALLTSIYLSKLVGARRTYLLGAACLTAGSVCEALARTPWELFVAGTLRSCAGFYGIPGITILQRCVPGYTRFAYCTYLALVFGGRKPGDRQVEPHRLAHDGVQPVLADVVIVISRCVLGPCLILIGLFLFQDDRPAQRPEHGFDFAGAGLFVASFGLVLFLLYRGNYLGWRVSTPIVTAALALLTALALFIWRELVAAEPFLNVGGFAYRTVALSMLASGFWCAAMYGVAIQLPDCLLVLGYEHWKTGWVILPMGLIVVAVMFVGGFVRDRGRLVWMFRLGLAGMTAMGFWLARIDLYTPWQWVMGVSSLWAVFAGLCMSPVSQLTFEGQPAGAAGATGGNEILHAHLQRDGGHPARRGLARPGRLVGAGIRTGQCCNGSGSSSGRYASHPRPPGPPRQLPRGGRGAGRGGPRLLGQSSCPGDRLPNRPAILLLPECGRADRRVFHSPAKRDQRLRHSLTGRLAFPFLRLRKRRWMH